MVGKEVIGDFEVEVFEDTYITAVHCKYGHKYSAQWSTEVPHLRNEYCAPNDLAERDYKGFEDEAEQAMLRKLENDGPDLRCGAADVGLTQELRACLDDFADG